MSNDLISRSALSKEICNKECNVPEFETERELNAFLLGLNAKQIKIMECLSYMPTAYDVDKVVERLEEEARCNQSEANKLAKHGDYGTATMLQGIAKGYKYSADIVKSGGIE